MKQYRDSFLSRRRLRPLSPPEMERSRWKYVFDQGAYRTSILGIINGLIDWTGWVLVFEVENGWIISIRLMRKEDLYRKPEARTYTITMERKE